MALVQEKNNSDLFFLTVVGGELVRNVPEGTEGAVKREWETKEGSTGVKWEIHYMNLAGFISNIELKDGDFGEQCLITVVNGDEKAVLALNTESRYFFDFASKYPNIDLNKEVTMNPYDFEKNGKKIKGLSVKQGNNKVFSFYYDIETKKNVNGFPVPDGNTKNYDKDDWKMYFIKVKKFLKSKLEQSIGDIEPVSNEKPKDESLKQQLIDKNEPTEEDDLPF